MFMNVLNIDVYYICIYINCKKKKTIYVVVLKNNKDIGFIFNIYIVIIILLNSLVSHSELYIYIHPYTLIYVINICINETFAVTHRIIRFELF